MEHFKEPDAVKRLYAVLVLDKDTRTWGIPGLQIGQNLTQASTTSRDVLNIIIHMVKSQYPGYEYRVAVYSLIELSNPELDGMDCGDKCH